MESNRLRELLCLKNGDFMAAKQKKLKKTYKPVYEADCYFTGSERRVNVDHHRITYIDDDTVVTETTVYQRDRMDQIIELTNSSDEIHLRIPMFCDSKCKYMDEMIQYTIRKGSLNIAGWFINGPGQTTCEIKIKNVAGIGDDISFKVLAIVIADMYCRANGEAWIILNLEDVNRKIGISDDKLCVVLKSLFDWMLTYYDRNTRKREAYQIITGLSLEEKRIKVTLNSKLVIDLKCYSETFRMEMERVLQRSVRQEEFLTLSREWP